jgi:hypothetical protein
MTPRDILIERCEGEIARCETLLRAGHRDIEGLLQGLQDWSCELRLLRLQGNVQPIRLVCADQGGVAQNLRLADPEVLGASNRRSQ